MSKTNCVNCGAAKDTSEIKCPFCGTTYLDLTAIDFASGEPCVCQFVMPYTNERVVLSMLALPRLEEFSVTTDTIDITSFEDTRRYYVPAMPSVNFAVSFTPLVRDNRLFSMRKE